jgi:hypothetical protein
MDRPDQIEAQTIYARRKWSAQRLDIPLNASKQEARKQWLKSLEEADFLPDEIHLPAWRIVSSAESAAEARQRFPEWASHFDDAIGREIEEFSQQFFRLEPAERRKEFTRLFNASRDNPRHQKRISALSPGLKLPAVNGNDDVEDEDAELMLADVEELSQHLRSLFLATPPARARLHQTFLREHAQQLPRWAAAAKVLKDMESPLIALVPEQWEELTGWDVRQRQAAAFQEGLEERIALEAIETRREQSQSQNNSGSFWEGLFFNRYAMFFGVWILIKIVGALLGSGSSSPKQNLNPPRYPLPNVQLEDFKRRIEKLREENRLPENGPAENEDTEPREEIDLTPPTLLDPNASIEPSAAESESWTAIRPKRQPASMETTESRITHLEIQLHIKQLDHERILREIEFLETKEASLKRREQTLSRMEDRSVRSGGSTIPTHSRMLTDLEELAQKKTMLESERDKLAKEIAEQKRLLSKIRSVNPGENLFDDAP